MFLLAALCQVSATGRGRPAQALPLESSEPGWVPRIKDTLQLRSVGAFLDGLQGVAKAQSSSCSAPELQVWAGDATLVQLTSPLGGISFP